MKEKACVINPHRQTLKKQPKRDYMSDFIVVHTTPIITYCPLAAKESRLISDGDQSLSRAGGEGGRGGGLTAPKSTSDPQA